MNFESLPLRREGEPRTYIRCPLLAAAYAFASKSNYEGALEYRDVPLDAGLRAFLLVLAAEEGNRAITAQVIENAANNAKNLGLFMNC